MEKKSPLNKNEGWGGLQKSDSLAEELKIRPSAACAAGKLSHTTASQRETLYVGKFLSDSFRFREI